MSDSLRAIYERLRTSTLAGFAELDAAIRDLEQDQAVVRVRPGDNLPDLLASAPAGQVFSIDPAFVHEGDLEFWKPCTLQSSTFLPTERVGEDLVGPTLKGQLLFNPPATDITFRNIRHQGTRLASNMAEVYGDRLVLDRCLMLGAPGGQKRAIYAEASGLRVLKSHIGGIYMAGYGDTQAIGAVRDTHDLLVDDCYLEAAGEVVLIGGDPIGAESRMCSDITIRNSVLTKKIEWRAIPGCAKTLYELKAVRRATLTGCYLFNSFRSAQQGFAITLTIRNQTDDGADTFATIEDVVIADNIIEHCASGFNILGRDDIHRSQRMTNVQILRTQLRDISRWTWGDGLGGRVFQIQGGPKDLIVDGLEVLAGAFQSGTDGTGEGEHAVAGAIYFDQPQWTLDNFQVLRSRLEEGEYGIHGGVLGVAALEQYAPGYTWTDVRVHRGGANPIRWPPGTVFV